MNFDIASDLHIFSEHTLFDTFFSPKSELLLLAGDVTEINRAAALFPVLKRMGECWKKILWIPGNHEYYYSMLPHCIDRLKKYLLNFQSFIVLDNDVYDSGDVVFIGSTLWSDMFHNDPLAVEMCRTNIRDYYCILKGPFGKKTILPNHTMALFKKNLAFLKKKVKEYKDRDVVIITHHAPSPLSISDRWSGSILNGAFMSDLSDFILSRPNIKMWVHGHVHGEFDYQIGHCRVVCHPKGYHGELYDNHADYRPLTVNLQTSIQTTNQSNGNQV